LNAFARNVVQPHLHAFEAVVAGGGAFTDLACGRLTGRGGDAGDAGVEGLVLTVLPSAFFRSSCFANSSKALLVVGGEASGFLAGGADETR